MAKDLRTSAEMRQARKMRKKGILILPRDEEGRRANKVVGRETQSVDQIEDWSG